VTVKRGHMVSKSYLLEWADSRNIVDVLDLEQGRGFATSFQNATVLSYVYEPEVLTHNLEGDYDRIENRGIPVIRHLRNGEQVTVEDKHRLVAFLDMHLDRGRYANQGDIRTPAVVLKTGGQVEKAELNLADRALLSQSLPDVTRLAALNLESWRWEVREATGLATGDGAVILWQSAESEPLSSVTFPLSPTQLLVIGRDIPGQPQLNTHLAQNSRRWVIGERGSLDLSAAARIAAARART
jgi:hypothetical protein